MDIFLLEDDLILNEIIHEHLVSKKHKVTISFDSINAQDILYSNKFDLLLLDVNVPGIDGFELLKNLRNNCILTPAIFITSLSMIGDVEDGFNAGCDDYIKKPFELKELDLRINNLSRILKIKETQFFEVDENLQINRQNQTICQNGKNLAITIKQLEILEYLIKNSHKTISTDELGSNIWSYENAPTNSTIRTYIKDLRNLIGENYIINTKGVGYRFNIK